MQTEKKTKKKNLRNPRNVAKWVQKSLCPKTRWEFNVYVKNSAGSLFAEPGYSENTQRKSDRLFA